MGSKTVYFLGAGASKAFFGFPTMDDFFDKFTVNNYPNLSHFLENYFSCDYFLKDRYGINLKIGNLNLEEVITALDLSSDRFGSFGNNLKGYLLDAKIEFNNYIINRLDIQIDQEDTKNRFNELCNKLNIIFGNISKKPSETKIADSIITLNYDLGIDHLLYYFANKNTSGTLQNQTLLRRMYDILGGRIELYIGDRPSLYWKENDLGFYLKLHGSLDWLYCINDKCENNRLFFPNFIDNKETHNTPGDPCILCGSPLSVVIVPPTLHKSFDKFPKLGLFWSLAHRELRNARKIVIFGVSFSSSDYYLAWLFRSSIGGKCNQKPELIVIDINSDICNKVEKITGIKPNYKSNIDEYINAYCV